MRPDQERVRNLLIDTVTLLCKNSLQFKDELHVEGLLGVSVDKKEVFFVHISKEFTNSPSEGATVTQTDSQDEETQHSQGSTERDGDKNTENNSQLEQDEIKVKTEAIDDAEDECSIVEDPNIKLEGISPAQMIAGQRRAHKRTIIPGTSAQEYSGDDSNLSAGYGMGEGMDSQYGEPMAKRRNEAHEVYDDGGDDDSGASAWPTLSGMPGFDPSQTFQETDNGLVGTDSQPGCSSWSTPGRGGPSDSAESFNASTTSDSTIWTRALADSANERGKWDCSICGRVCSKRSALERHLLTHTGEKPFTCMQCGGRFRRKHHLSRHYRNKHSAST